MTTPVIPAIMIVIPQEHFGTVNKLAAETALKSEAFDLGHYNVIRTVNINPGRAAGVLHDVRAMIDKFRREGRYDNDQEFAVVVPDEKTLFGVEPDMFAAPHIRFVDLARVAACG
jgi:hypothetical protein